MPHLQAGSVNYEFKCGLMYFLPKFHGLAGDNLHKHLMKSHVVCSTMRRVDTPEKLVKTKSFPFSLCDTSNDWLRLQSNSYHHID